MNRAESTKLASALFLGAAFAASLGVAASCGLRGPKDLEGESKAVKPTTRGASDVGPGNYGTNESGDDLETPPIDSGRSETIREEEFLHFLPGPTSTSNLAPKRRKSFVLHARELEEVFVRYFDGAARSTPTAEVFDINARNALGTPSFVGDVAGAFVRTSRAETVGFGYVRALRSFAGPACDRLVKTEREAGVVAGNKILVAESAPTAAQVSAIMTSLFGFRPAGAVHEGAAAYATLFASAVAARGSTPAVVDEQYKLLCVALATDARVFLR